MTTATLTAGPAADVPPSADSKPVSDQSAPLARPVSAEDQPRTPTTLPPGAADVLDALAAGLPLPGEVQEPELRAAARMLWTESALAGMPLSGAELGRRLEMSERWGRERAAEARRMYPSTAEPAGRADRPARAVSAAAAAEKRPVTSGAPLVSTSRQAAAAPAVPHVTEPAFPLAGMTASSSAASTAPSGTAGGAPVVVTPRQRRRSALAAALAMTPGLSISWWSFTVYLRTGGAPVWLAAVASASVDGIAIYAALYAAWFTDHGKPARLAKASTYAMVLASALVNWLHATAMHWSLGLHVVLTVPSFGAAIALELALQRMRVVARARREKRRETRQAARIDADLWLMHPVKVWKARRREGLARLAEVFGTD